ncbi:hypothetical protein ACFODT_04720 [Vibrio zhugei]|uniref:Uncharacterized protein n=1 Tax=Vibrio zhugei TaxID=2479546 RepID=A0ABV7C764_9VIBR
METAVAKDYFETQAMQKQQLLREGKLLEEKVFKPEQIPEFAESL